jgi:hypothetical protein
MAYTVAISSVLPAIAGESTATPSTAASADASDASTSATRQPEKPKPQQAAGQLVNSPLDARIFGEEFTRHMRKASLWRN